MVICRLILGEPRWRFASLKLNSNEEFNPSYGSHGSRDNAEPLSRPACLGALASVVSHKRLELFSLIFRIFPDSWSRAAGLDLFQGLFAPAELVDDRVNRRCPDEGPWVGVPSAEEFVYCGLQVLDTDKDATPNAFTSQFPEPALHQIQPA